MTLRVDLSQAQIALCSKRRYRVYTTEPEQRLGRIAVLNAVVLSRWSYADRTGMNLVD